MGRYFGVGIENPQHMHNVGIAWRSAYQLGASFIFTIGKKYKKSVADTYNIAAQLPLLEFSSIEEAWKIMDCDWTAVETPDREDGKLKPIPLWDFTHPKKVAYLFGNESDGMSSELLHKCFAHIYVPAVRRNSYNLSMTVTFILWDRLHAKSMNLDRAF